MSCKFAQKHILNQTLIAKSMRKIDTSTSWVKADSFQLQEIARKLRRLYETSPKNVEALAEWNANARKFSEEVTIPLPAEVSHYLHDADIRIKDPAYRKRQDEMIAHIISSLDGGRIPPSRYVKLSVSLRLLCAIILSLFMFTVAAILL